MKRTILRALHHRIINSFTLIVGGAACLVSAALFLRELPRLRKTIRLIYIQKGIIEVAVTGIQTAASLSLPPED